MKQPRHPILSACIGTVCGHILYDNRETVIEGVKSFAKNIAGIGRKTIKTAHLIKALHTPAFEFPPADEDCDCGDNCKCSDGNGLEDAFEKLMKAALGAE